MDSGSKGSVMTDEFKRTPLTRRDVIRMSGSAALAAVAVRATGLPGLDAAPKVAGRGGFAGSAPYVTGATVLPASTSADLLIEDGTPNWWLSPDIWAVPGNDPNGTPGTPAGGDTAYV